MFNKKNLFKTMFIISLTFHALIFLPLPKLNFIKDSTANIPATSYMNISISPVNNTQPQVRKKTVSKKSRPKRNIRQAKTPKIKMTNARKHHLARKTKYRPANKNISAAKRKKSKRVITKQKAPAKELSKNKSYLAYYELINARLRNALIYPAAFSEGEISLSFVVGSDGRLISVEILPEDSSNNAILSETAVRIVKNASPFPPFPDGLLRMRLKFSVVICFRGNS